jgi:hypothetical protein
MRVARELFELEADEWLLEAETLGGYAFALQFRGVQCKGSPGGSLWQILPTARSEPTSARIGAPPVLHLLGPVGNSLAITSLVRQVRDRGRRGLLRREPIASLAYWQREVLEAHFEGKQPANEALNVSPNLWSEIGRLSALHDWREGRKVVGGLIGPALHRREVLFLTVAYGHLLYRLAETEAGGAPAVNLNVEMVKAAAEKEFLAEQMRFPQNVTDEPGSS